MAQIRLANLRIGFDYAVDLKFPEGFLAAGEAVAGRLRRYPGGPLIASFADDRTGDTVHWNILAAETANIEPGTYIAEAIIYPEATPGVSEIPLPDNTYVLEANYSPSAPEPEVP